MDVYAVVVMMSYNKERYTPLLLYHASHHLRAKALDRAFQAPNARLALPATFAVWCVRQVMSKDIHCEKQGRKGCNCNFLAPRVGIHN